MGLIIWSFTAGQALAQTLPKQAKEIELRVVSIFPTEDDICIHLWKSLKNLINKEAKGQLVLKYFGGSGVFPAFEQPDALRKGIIDMTICASAYFPLAPEAIDGP